MSTEMSGDGAASSSASSQTQVRAAGRPNLIFGGNYGENVDPSRWVVIYPPYIDAGRKEREVCLSLPPLLYTYASEVERKESCIKNRQIMLTAAN